MSLKGGGQKMSQVCNLTIFNEENMGKNNISRN